MLTIRDLVSRKNASIMSVRPDTPVNEAMRLLATHGARDLLIVENEALCGIFSERDYVRKVAGKRGTKSCVRVCEIMETKWVSISPDYRVEDCLTLVASGPVRYLPVLDRKKIVGLITRDDVMMGVIEMQAARIDDLEKYISGGYLIKGNENYRPAYDKDCNVTGSSKLFQ